MIKRIISLTLCSLLISTSAMAEMGYILGVRSVFVHEADFNDTTHHYRFIGKTKTLEKVEAITLPQYSKHFIRWLPYFPLNDDFHFIIEQDGQKILDVIFDEEKKYFSRGMGNCSQLKDLSQIYPRPFYTSYVPIKLTTLACSTPAGLVEIEFFCDPIDKC